MTFFDRFPKTAILARAHYAVGPSMEEHILLIASPSTIDQLPTTKRHRWRAQTKAYPGQNLVRATVAATDNRLRRVDDRPWPRAYTPCQPIDGALMGQSKDYYQLLGVDRSATAEQIRKAYRKLARTYHPDVNKSPEAATKFAEVTEAYEVLSDAKKRKAYDRFGHAGVGVGAGGFSPGGWSTNVGPGGEFDAGDFANAFEQFFGAGGGSPFGAGAPPTAQPRPVPRRGGDLTHPLSVSFMTAARGGAEPVRISTGDSGSQTINVKIPPGIEPGAKLRIKGKGHAGSAGGQAGDLILTVTVGDHPYFRREGVDLVIDVPITIAESAFGVTVTVPLLKGCVQIKVPPGTSSGQRLRVPGKGVQDTKGRWGDFLAVVQIVAPDSISEQGRGLLETLAKELNNPRERVTWADDVGDNPD